MDTQKMQPKITFIKSNKWNNGNEAVMQATNGKRTIVFSYTKKKDQIGILYVVECTACGYFEEYGISKVKERIKNLFN